MRRSPAHGGAPCVDSLGESPAGLASTHGEPPRRDHTPLPRIEPPGESPRRCTERLRERSLMRSDTMRCMGADVMTTTPDTMRVPPSALGGSIGLWKMVASHKKENTTCMTLIAAPRVALASVKPRLSSSCAPSWPASTTHTSARSAAVGDHSAAAEPVPAGSISNASPAMSTTCAMHAATTVTRWCQNVSDVAGTHPRSWPTHRNASEFVTADATARQSPTTAPASAIDEPSSLPPPLSPSEWKARSLSAPLKDPPPPSPKLNL
mmetsp:Transcript_34150/g.101519  ORF Transcript_34150/g.101519 Transcript_34150/m.101519 type:complete len:265 (-) Transcript_34150:836-1630(-)